MKESARRCATSLTLMLLVGLSACNEKQLTEPAAKSASTFNSTELADRTLHRRAVEAVIWA
jgi:hypothetical protein